MDHNGHNDSEFFNPGVTTVTASSNLHAQPHFADLTVDYYLILPFLK
jgi:hypothetical protein